jgi:ribosome-associated protein
MVKKEIHDDAASLIEQVVAGMKDKKAKNIVSLDMSDIPNAVCRYFVVCHATSKTQVNAIYDGILEKVFKNCGVNPTHREGYENSEWILIDYFDVVAHVFLEETRSFYNLESLWADAAITTYASD